jgi:hypothetical protein
VTTAILPSKLSIAAVWSAYGRRVQSEDLSRAAAVLGGDVAWPAVDGEPVFDEPWQGRAMALAFEVLDRTGLPWDAFRERLVEAIADDPARPYYESWLVALERLALDVGAVDASTIGDARNHAAAYRYDEEGVGDIETFPFPPDTEVLHDVLTELFAGPWWAQIRFGPLIQGAAYELRLRAPARLSMLDGYVTIDDGGSHFHVCIGDHRAAPALASRRRCQHAELYRIWMDGAPTSWGLRMFNGDDDQQLNVLLPNPFLDDDDRPLDEPDWSRLACWDELRRRVLALAPDPADRLGRRFRHP